MRALRLFALAAALVVPAAAAHARYGVYVGPSVRYAAPAYGEGSGYWVPGHWSYGPGGRFWLGAQWMARPGYYGGHEWREHHGFYDVDHGWRDHGRDWGRERPEGRRW